MLLGEYNFNYQILIKKKLTIDKLKVPIITIIIF